MSLRMGKITRTQLFNVGTGQGETSLFSSEFLESKGQMNDFLAGEINPADTYPMMLVGWLSLIRASPSFFISPLAPHFSLSLAFFP